MNDRDTGVHFYHQQAQVSVTILERRLAKRLFVDEQNGRVGADC
jgi:hypothetical protein